MAYDDVLDYYEATRKMIDLAKQGQETSQEYERLTQELDAAWSRMTPAEQDNAEELTYRYLGEK